MLSGKRRSTKANTTQAIEQGSWGCGRGIRGSHNMSQTWNFLKNFGAVRMVFAFVVVFCSALLTLVALLWHWLRPSRAPKVRAISRWLSVKQNGFRTVSHASATTLEQNSSESYWSVDDKTKKKQNKRTTL